MSDELLADYQRELAFLRRMGPQFAAAQPRLAGALSPREGMPNDPHVDRLLEALAFLNARIHRKLRDDYSALTDSLLHILFPHYQRPVPAMSIVQFGAESAGAEGDWPIRIPADSPIETDPIDGEPCRFRTRYPVELWPITVEAAQLQGHPLKAPQTRWLSQSTGVLRLQLHASAAIRDGQAPSPERLRFYLRGQVQHVYDLYELLLNDTLGVAARAAGSNEPPVLLPRGSVAAVGFEEDDWLLPYPARSFDGFRLLTEFFAFPEKFLFFDLCNLPSFAGMQTDRMELFFYQSRAVPGLQANITARTFQLGCAPVVNLFPQRADPIRLDHRHFEYHVVPDGRRSLSFEVFSIDRVSAISPDDRIVEFEPFYSPASIGSEQKAYWYALRKPAREREEIIDRGTEVYLTLVEPELTAETRDGWLIDVETTCLNRDLPNRLPFGGGQPRLHLVKSPASVTVSCLTAPTPVSRPPLGKHAIRRLVTHLALQHCSLADLAQGTAVLKEILSLYDLTETEGTRSMIEGVLALRGRPVIENAGRIASREVYRGIELTLDLDEDRFAGSGVYLFASVLERFFGLYCMLNSFSKLVAFTNKRPTELARWPARAGHRLLI